MTPQVRVLRGSPDDLELAALVAGIVAGRAAPVDGHDHDRRRARQAANRRRWLDGATRLRDRHTPGGDAWRWSGNV